MSLIRNVQKSYGAHPNHLLAFIPGIKRPGLEVDQTSPSSAEGKNEWSSTYTPKYTFVAPRGKTVVLLHRLFRYI
jgi:hypothetical protein